MDSATAAAVAQDAGYELYMLHTSYGQQTESKEYECAQAQAEAFDAADFLHLTTDHLSKIGASSLTDDEMDVEEADLESDEIPSSYVPFRNANLLSMATSYAEANDCEAVFIGAHSEDFGVSGLPTGVLRGVPAGRRRRHETGDGHQRRSTVRRVVENRHRRTRSRTRRPL